MSKPQKSNKKVSATPGLAIFGCLATGVVAIFGGLVGLVGEIPNPVGAGVCLMSAALAFGIVAHISFSD